MSRWPRKLKRRCNKAYVARGKQRIIKVLPNTLFPSHVNDKVIEHSENKTITQTGLFGNEVEPGVLKPNVKRRARFRNANKVQAADHISILSFLTRILTASTFLAHWTGAL